MIQSPLQLLIAAAGLLLLLGVAAAVTFVLPGMAHHQILLVGLALVIYGVTRLHWARVAAGWPRVDAVLTAVDEVEVRSLESQYGPPTRYRYPVVRYRYERAGQSWTGTRVGHSLRDIAVLVGETPYWSDWCKGQRITAYVHPQRPDEAMLRPQLRRERRSHFLALIIAGALLTACWAALARALG